MTGAGCNHVTLVTKRLLKKDNLCSDMKERLFSNWTIIRGIRLIIGIIIAVQGMQTGTWSLAVLGGLFSLMALLNTGCGIGGNCSVSPQRPNRKDTQDVEYEEVQ